MKIIFHFQLILALFVMVLNPFLLSGCQPGTGNSRSFVNIGKFTVKKLPENCKELKDGAGRTLILVPRGEMPPEGYDRHQIIEVPVRRVVAYSGYHVGMLKAIGVLDEVLVGVTKEKEYWAIPEVLKGMEKGRVTYIGESDAIDYERLKSIHPDLILTWDLSVIPMIKELDIPVVITSTGVAMDLDTRMRFAQFLAFFFNREREAKKFVSRVSTAIDHIRYITASVKDRPKVIWGDIYEKRVLVEPGNAWAAEMVDLAGGEYLFDDVSGAS